MTVRRRARLVIHHIPPCPCSPPNGVRAPLPLSPPPLAPTPSRPSPSRAHSLVPHSLSPPLPLAPAPSRASLANEINASRHDGIALDTCGRVHRGPPPRGSLGSSRRLSTRPAFPSLVGAPCGRGPCVLLPHPSPCALTAAIPVTASGDYRRVAAKVRDVAERCADHRRRGWAAVGASVALRGSLSVR